MKTTPKTTAEYMREEANRVKVLRCTFCGAESLVPVLTGRMQALTLPNHVDPSNGVPCCKSGSFYSYDFYVSYPNG